MSLPNYKNPPLSEVVFGVWFNPIKYFKVPHIGDYWQIIKKDYPLCEQMPPMGEFIVENLPFPFPRSWFISRDQSHLIQLQNNCFYLNWRKLKMDFNYPKYEVLFDSFIKRFQELIDFFKQEKLGGPEIKTCELAYINHIEYNQLFSTPADLGNILPDAPFQQKNKHFLPAPKHQSWRFDFPFPEDYGILKVEVKHATRKEDRTPLFVLELSAKGLGQKNSIDDLKKWFNMSHEWIVKGFTDLTSQEAQEKLWNRTS